MRDKIHSMRMQIENLKLVRNSALLVTFICAVGTLVLHGSGFRYITFVLTLVSLAGGFGLEVLSRIRKRKLLRMMRKFVDDNGVLKLMFVQGKDGKYRPCYTRNRKPVKQGGYVS